MGKRIMLRKIESSFDVVEVVGRGAMSRYLVRGEFLPRTDRYGSGLSRSFGRWSGSHGFASAHQTVTIPNSSPALEYCLRGQPLGWGSPAKQEQTRGK